MVAVQDEQIPEISHGGDGVMAVVDARTVATHFGVTQRCIKGWIARGVFPQPRRIGSRCVRWSVSELNAWIEAGCPRPPQSRRDAVGVSA